MSSDENYEETVGIIKKTDGEDSNLVKEEANSVEPKFHTKYLSLVFIETFTMIFFAEWGDKSQVATILLSAREVII